MNWRNYLIALCLSGVMLALVFTPISSSQTASKYDPWLDINDDGIIDIFDVVSVCAAYDTKGTPINKTRLLLEILAKIEALEARVNALEANYSVTNIKLAPYAIPFNSTFRPDPVSTESSALKMIPGMSVTITLNRTSHLLILFSTEAWQENEGNYRINTDAVVINLDTGVQRWAPGPYYLTPYIYDPPWYDNQIMHYMTYTSQFIASSVPAGKYEIQIRWAVTPGGKAYAWYRVLTVIALPA